MKVLVISGTPKKDGITHSFVMAAVESATAAGAETELLTLSDRNLMTCKMCADGWGICFNEHHCEFGDKDGFNALQETVRESDAYVFITPVYWSEVSEVFKTFIDRLRRCQATKQWNEKDVGKSFFIGKPSILAAIAGGGGGGILTALQDIERAITQMGGDVWPRETCGIFDYIGVNRWNQDFKRDALRASIAAMVKYTLEAQNQESN